jgi:hypothetical protein
MATNAKIIVVMKTIVIILIALCLCGCYSYKIYEFTNCNLDKKSIIKEYKNQIAKIKETGIKLSNEAKIKNNCSVFDVYILEWNYMKGVRFKISTIMLKTSTRIYINTYYVNNELRENVKKEIALQYINSAIRVFRQEYNETFNEEELLLIENKFKEGVVVYYL